MLENSHEYVYMHLTLIPSLEKNNLQLTLETQACNALIDTRAEPFLVDN